MTYVGSMRLWPQEEGGEVYVYELACGRLELFVTRVASHWRVSAHIRGPALRTLERFSTRDAARASAERVVQQYDAAERLGYKQNFARFCEEQEEVTFGV